MTDRLHVEHRERALLVTFERPEKKNAFDDAMWLALRDTLDAARTDPAVAVVVLHGGGGNFSAGVDLGSFTGSSDPDASPSEIMADQPFSQFMNVLVVFDKPLVAAATGVAVGIGATLLLHCDVVYVGEGLRLRFPFVNLGVVPEAASSYLLPRVVGAQRAAELLLTAEWIDARRAVEVGIAARSYPDEVLLDAAMVKAAEMAQWPVASLQATKACLLACTADGIATAREVEDRLMLERAGSPENIEAVVAFIEKRAPDFRQFRTEDPS